MLLNCDLGESYGNWRMGMDARSCRISTRPTWPAVSTAAIR
jgi:lactam utilization protein B